MTTSKPRASSWRWALRAGLRRLLVSYFPAASLRCQASSVAYTGASRDMLADRLRKLESAGIIERRQYSEHPPRFG
jgi:HxlR-like helix-turn-helix